MQSSSRVVAAVFAVVVAPAQAIQVTMWNKAGTSLLRPSTLSHIRPRQTATMSGTHKQKISLTGVAKPKGFQARAASHEIGQQVQQREIQTAALARASSSSSTAVPQFQTPTDLMPFEQLKEKIQQCDEFQYRLGQATSSLVCGQEFLNAWIQTHGWRYVDAEVIAEALQKESEGKCDHECRQTIESLREQVMACPKFQEAWAIAKCSLVCGEAFFRSWVAAHYPKLNIAR